MTIQIPNPGTGNGATGDNEFVLWSKVKDNFTDQTNAASRLVGEAKGNVMEVGAFGFGGSIFSAAKNGSTMKAALDTSRFFEMAIDHPLKPSAYAGTVAYGMQFPTAYFTGTLFFPRADLSANTNIVFRLSQSNGTTFKDLILWHNQNTTKDANGFLKGASPIVKVFADKVELNGEAEDQDVTYKKDGIGDYTITTVSGLSTDGWYIELPKDMNGNPKVAVTLSEVDGVISLKTYKRIFSMETFTFEPDLDHPLDIPDTRWIDLRLNEIPVEMPEMPAEV